MPEPNTWRELLAALDEQAPVAGRRVAVQEYGRTNPELLDGLRARGAEVLRVPVYRWDYPRTWVRCATPSRGSPTARSTSRCSPARARSTT